MGPSGDEALVVTFKDLRELKYCSPSILDFCQRHGINPRRFRLGVPVQELRATGHFYAIAACDYVEAKNGRRGR